MAQPTVTFYANITGTDSSGNVTQALNSSQRVAFLGATGLSGVQTWTDAQLKNVTKPTGTPTIANECWVETGTNQWTKVPLYTGAVNANDYLFRWNFSTEPASAPIYTAYDQTAYTATNAYLAGNATDTNNTSFLKACRTNGSLTSTNWCSATTGSAGAQTAVNTGQSLQGDTQYLQQTDTTTLNQYFNIVAWVGANLPAGTYEHRLSTKYTYT